MILQSYISCYLYIVNNGPGTARKQDVPILGTQPGPLQAEKYLHQHPFPLRGGQRQRQSNQEPGAQIRTICHVARASVQRGGEVSGG